MGLIQGSNGIYHLTVPQGKWKQYARQRRTQMAQESPPSHQLPTPANFSRTAVRALQDQITMHNADGSTELYIQADSPGKDKEANWLPLPKDKFVLMFRLYWPKATAPSILDG